MSSHGKMVSGDTINKHGGTEFDYVGTKGRYFRLAGGASDGYGLGRGTAGPDRRCTTTTDRALRVIVYDGSILMSEHAPPQVQIGVTGGPESVQDG